MQDSQSLSINGVDISAMFLKQEGYLGVSPKDCIVEGGKALIILPVNPLLFLFRRVLLRLFLNQLIIPH